MQLAGELSKISLPSLVQLVRNGGLTGEIALAQGAKTATIYVEKGRVAHVESDAGSGREAFLDLFLWMTGTFSFIEGSLGDIVRSIPSDEPMDRLLREGVAYLEQKRYLDQLRINGQTVLRPTSAARQAREVPLLDALDGRKTLSEALSDSRMSRREYIQAVYRLISDGLAVVAEADVADDTDKVSIPGWVVARLQQDNADLSQAIIGMVIWVDRVKCWMYQADADMARIMEELCAESTEVPEAPAPEPFAPEPPIIEPEPTSVVKTAGDLSAQRPPAGTRPDLASLLKDSKTAHLESTVGTFPGGASSRPGKPAPQAEEPPKAPPPEPAPVEPAKPPQQQRAAREPQKQPQPQATGQVLPTQPHLRRQIPDLKTQLPQQALAPAPQIQQQLPGPAPAQQRQPPLSDLIPGPSGTSTRPPSVPNPETQSKQPSPVETPPKQVPQPPAGEPQHPAQPLPVPAPPDIRPSAGLSRTAPHPEPAANDGADEPVQQTADESSQGPADEGAMVHKDDAAKVDWPKAAMPKKASVDTYPPKQKPSIEF